MFGILVSITIVVLLLSTMSDKKNGQKRRLPVNEQAVEQFRRNRNPFRRNKEGFFVTSQNAYVDPVTGAIKGPGIMTDGMTRKSMKDITDSVAKTGYGSDDPGALGVTIGSGFDKAYQSQLEIDQIDQRAVDGYQQQRDLDTISKKINSGENNFNNALYIRTSKPTKMVIEPNSIRGVIDAKYLPDRDKNYQIATVSTAVGVQGYDVNIERLGEYLTNTHFSKISKHGKHNRVPTAAGATGGGKVNSEIGVDEEGSANAQAVANTIQVEGNNAVVENNGENIAIPLEGEGGESFRSTYVRGNHM